MVAEIVAVTAVMEAVIGVVTAGVTVAEAEVEEEAGAAAGGETTVEIVAGVEAAIIGEGVVKDCKLYEDCWLVAQTTRKRPATTGELKLVGSQLEIQATRGLDLRRSIGHYRPPWVGGCLC
mmetsp:Transcript_71696/g.134086  ORF Transcript_71696/g.134086 Transcript_71696/m.134086 type:complete len:121 (+) Transcript_71696:441-803(+)